MVSSGGRLRGHLGSLAPLFAVQTFASAVNISLVFLLPDLLVSRHAAPWMVRGGGHFALIAGGCLSLVPAGQASDRWSARRMLVFANLTTALALGLLLLRGSASTLDLLVVTAVGAFNGINNIAAVAEGNRLLPGQASAVSALLMGLPWCVAALGPVVAGVLADPARGGTPAGALGWFMLLMPLGLAAAASRPVADRRPASGSRGRACSVLGRNSTRSLVSINARRFSMPAFESAMCFARSRRDACSLVSSSIIRPLTTRWQLIRSFTLCSRSSRVGAPTPLSCSMTSLPTA